MNSPIVQRKIRRFGYGAVVLTICSFLLPWSSLRGPLERGFSDYRHAQFASDRAASPDVVMVDIDEYSLKLLGPHYGRWPWPRKLYRQMLEFISIGGPSGVFFDILFSEPMLGVEDDKNLAAISGELGNVSHAMNLFPMEETGAYPLPEGFTDKFGVQWVDGPPDSFQGPSFQDFALSLSLHLPQLPLIHVVSFHQDPDGVFRRGPLLFRYGRTWLPSLGLAAAMQHTGARKVRAGAGVVRLEKPGESWDIPVDSHGRMRVNYYPQGKAPKKVSFGPLMDSARALQSGEVEDPSELAVNPFDFEGKLVLVGGSATGLKDLKVTPVDPSYPGALLQATVISNILQRNFIWEPGPVYQGLLSWLLVLSVYAGVYFSSLILVRVFLPLGLMLLFTGFSLFVFQSYEWDIMTVTPILLSLGAFLDGLVFMGLVEARERRQLRSSLGKYLSPAVTAQLLSQGEDPRAEVGRAAPVTVLFMDIRNFTGISENLTPTQVVEGLNRYLSRMTDFIFENDGTLDKFIGDAIMVFWGAPLPDDRHELHAVQCALQMQELLGGEGIFLTGGGKRIRCRAGIGINSGSVIVGNIGGDRHLDYTVIGDNVNIASRLEGLTTLYRVPVLISESTYDKISSEILCRPLGEALVKGRIGGIQLFQPLCPVSEGEELVPLLQDFREAVKKFEAKDLAGARRCWEKAAVGPWQDDPTIAFFIELCDNGGDIHVLTRQKKIAA